MTGYRISKERLVPPKYSWFEGILLIQRAFHGVPPGFEDWPLSYWDVVCDYAYTLIENDMKRQGLV